MAQSPRQAGHKGTAAYWETCDDRSTQADRKLAQASDDIQAVQVGLQAPSRGRGEKVISAHQAFRTSPEMICNRPQTDFVGRGPGRHPESNV
jgi:hypothetical protein